MNKPRKVPLRKCVVTGEMLSKKELVRIVRTKDGEVFIDPTGKKSGRGAYLSKTKEAVLTAKKKHVLENHLNVKINNELYDELIEYIEGEKPVQK